jgi:hypothetical protein
MQDQDPSRSSQGFFRGILMWRYARGTWQYDLLCALILAFVFFVPTRCFAPRNAQSTSPKPPVAAEPAPPPAVP